MLGFLRHLNLSSRAKNGGLEQRHNPNKLTYSPYFSLFKDFEQDFRALPLAKR